MSGEWQFTDAYFGGSDFPTEVECDHRWITHMIQMPQGYEKPGVTSCSKCGKFKPINKHLQSTSGLTKP